MISNLGVTGDLLHYWKMANLKDGFIDAKSLVTNSIRVPKVTYEVIM